MTDALQKLLPLLNRATEDYSELRQGVQEATNIASQAPGMALTRIRKVLEFVVHEVYERHINEPPGTRPLENLLQRLVRDGHFPRLISAYATSIKDLGNVGTHTFEKVTAEDVRQALNQLAPILEWYLVEERPEALKPGPLPVAPAAPSPKTEEKTSEQPRTPDPPREPADNQPADQQKPTISEQVQSLLRGEPWYWRWLGPALPVCAFVLFFLYVWRIIPAGVSPFVLMIFGVVFFIVFGLAYLIFDSLKQARQQRQPAGAVDNEPERITSIQWAARILLWAVLAVFLFLLFVLTTSLIFGWPLDLRQNLNPALVVRKDYTEDHIQLTAHEGSKYFKHEYPDVGSGEEGKLRAKMSVWKKWLNEGVAQELGTVFLVYESASFADYYKPFDARLCFAAGLQARLADGFAYLKRTDPFTGDEVHRFVRFYIAYENQDRKPGEDATENAFFRITINPGDTLVIAIQLAPLDNKPLPRTLPEYGGNLVLTKR